MKNKLKTIGLILSGVVLAALLYYAYGKYYEAIYNKGFNEAAEIANLFIDLNNAMVDLCRVDPYACGTHIKREAYKNANLELR